MKVKSIKATLHRFEVKVPLIRQPMHRRAVVCEVETSAGISGFGSTDVNGASRVPRPPAMITTLGWGFRGLSELGRPSRLCRRCEPSASRMSLSNWLMR